MTTTPTTRLVGSPTDDADALAASRDRYLMTAHEALLKGAFEHDRDVAHIIGPHVRPFAELFQRAETDPVQRMLRQHGTLVKSVADASRAVALTHQSARSGRSACALVPNAHLPRAIPSISKIAAGELPAGAALALVLEDDSLARGTLCPIQFAASLALPTLAPRSIAELKDHVDYALRLSRSSQRAVALIAHRSLFQRGEMVEARPNRAAPPADALLARQRRKPRWSDVQDITRMARRMELNQVRSQPNPGEVVPLGLITVGPTDQTAHFLLGTLRLLGRVPLFQLGLIHPLDEVALSRFLSRCAQVIILEPRPGRPGAAEQAILHIEAMMHQRSEQCAAIHSRRLPGPSLATPGSAPSSDHANDAPSAGRANVPDNADMTTSRNHSSSGASDSVELTAEDVLHPSLLIRRLAHLMHSVRPQLHISSRLVVDPPKLPAAPPPRGRDLDIAGAMSRLRRLLKDVDQWLRNQDESGSDQPVRRALAIDGNAPSGQFDRIIPVEMWDAAEFAAAGVEAIRQAALERQPWVLIVCDFSSRDRLPVRQAGFNLERLSRGSVPDEVVDITSIERISIGDQRALREKLQQAVKRQGLTVLLIADASPPQFDTAAIDRRLAEIDRSGVEPLQRIIRSTEEVCRFPRHWSESDDEDVDIAPLKQHELKSDVAVEHNPKQFGTRVRLYVRPMQEQIDVIRTRPPTWIWRRRPPAGGAGTGQQLDLPTPLHRRAHEWRAHLAGVRSSPPGAAAMVLASAGRLMGYDVAWVNDESRIGAGQRAWTQVLFTRARRPDQPTTTHSPMSPFGEADLLIGLDGYETLRAIDPSLALRVAASDRTFAIVNTSAMLQDAQQAADRRPAKLQQHIAEALAQVTRDDARHVDDIASICRRWFYTDRVTDMVLLGMAYQRGLIPVNLDAIDNAVGRIERRGFGRAREAFTFGRHLAFDENLIRRRPEERADDLSRIVRRTIKSLRGRRLMSRTLADRFKRMLEQSLTTMPGLSETAAGRRALHDFVLALYRCVEWAGIDYADRYATLITDLYRRDRPETGRAMTRDAILPLAEAMLIRDPIYMASMATSLEERRRFRKLHNIKAARGDRIERRYLTRIDLTGFGYRVRADLRSSDWPARLARAARYVVPIRWRGSQRERDMREYMISFVQRATYHNEVDYRDWCDATHRLHNQAREERLRDMAMAELRMLAEPVMDGGRARSDGVTK